MKSLIFKITLFIILLSGAYFWCVHRLSNGYVDVYYNKCTKKASSLIIGMSRGQQGLDPYIIEQELSEFNFDGPLMNFAFNSYQSPFGEVYLEGIKKKLDKSSKNGIFIISISPGSFAAYSLNDEVILKTDKNMILGKIDDFTSNPNYDYITNCYAQPLYSLFYNADIWEHMTVHPNGWNEVKVRSNTSILTEKEISNWKSYTFQTNKKRVEKEKISQYRINSFITIIEYLKNKGNVFILRMPTDIKTIELENNVWSDFDVIFDSISKNHDVPYLNYSIFSKDYKTYDGSHLLSESAKQLSTTLSLDIKKSLSNINSSE